MEIKKNSATPKGKHHLKNHFKNTITKETRQEAFITRPVRRKTAILEVLGEREMTAREIAYEMGYQDLNAVKPRLSELVGKGRVEVVGKAFDEVTKRKVAIYRRVG